MRIPTYLDGKPTNLQAAIIDAEYWLRWLRSRINEQRPPVELNEYRARMRPELIEKLRLAIRALEEFLPDEELLPELFQGPEALTPVQRAKFDLIKEKLRAKQQEPGMK